MADVTFAQIEAAMVTRLDSQMPYLAQCASYAGQIEDANNGLPVEAPACFVMFDGFRTMPEQSDHAQHVGTVEFSVVVFGDSYTGSTDSRTDTYGAYALVQAVMTAIDDSTLGLTGFPGLRVSAVEMLRVDKVRAIYRVRFDGLILLSR